MRNVNELKKQLLDIRDDEWKVPNDINNYELTLEMMTNIGSTDPVIRDELILELLFKMIVENDLSDKEVKALMDLALSNQYLFYNIGSKEDDSVFKRAFTILLVGGMVDRHNQSQNKLFTEEDIKRICHEVIRYVREEKDVRGYVAVKGWAHTAAHSGDALGEIALSKEIDTLELLEMLYAIKEKVCIRYYTYVNSEDERLVSAVINIIGRRTITDEKVVNWIKSFENIEMTYKSPEEHNLICNRKNFLSALYFRFKRGNESKVLIDAIEEVINNTTPSYFK